MVPGWRSSLPPPSAQFFNETFVYVWRRHGSSRLQKRIDMYCRFIFFYASFFSLSCKTLVSTRMSINPWNQSLVLCLNEKKSVLILEQIWFLSLLHCMRWIMVSLILSVTSKSYVAGFVSHVSPINQQLLYGICHENNNYKKKNETH